MMLAAGLWRRAQPNTVFFVLVDSDGTEVLGLGDSFTVQVAKPGGGGFVAGAGDKAEVGLGWYAYTCTADEADTAGPVALAVEGVGTVQQNLEYVVEDRVTSAVLFTYTVTNSADGAPLPGVWVGIAVDAGGQILLWTGHTDAFGVARAEDGSLPRLTPGAYYIFRRKHRFTFADPDVEVIP